MDWEAGQGEAIEDFWIVFEMLMKKISNKKLKRKRKKEKKGELYPLNYDLHIVSVSPPMGILFSRLRRTEVFTLWSSFFLSFMSSMNCILSFWANIHLSLSVYHVCSIVIVLPHSG